MRIAWLQPWFHRRQERRTPTLAAAVSRWPFIRRSRRGKQCGPCGPRSPLVEPQDVPIERVTLSLSHHLEVSQVTHFLLNQLNCDAWHVACRHDHQMVVQLTLGGLARYGISFDCSPAVEKAVYHGSRAWALTIIPLHGNDNLPAQRLTEIKAGLAALHG